jgi:hypothetical protein
MHQDVAAHPEGVPNPPNPIPPLPLLLLLLLLLAQAAREIAATMSQSANRVYLDTDTLLLNISEDASSAKQK